MSKDVSDYDTPVSILFRRVPLRCDLADLFNEPLSSHIAEVFQKRGCRTRREDAAGTITIAVIARNTLQMGK